MIAHKTFTQGPHGSARDHYYGSPLYYGNHGDAGYNGWNAYQLTTFGIFDKPSAHKITIFGSLYYGSRKITMKGLGMQCASIESPNARLFETKGPWDIAINNVNYQ